VTRVLRGRGWVVVRIWEHDLKSGANVAIRRIRVLCCRCPPGTSKSHTAARSASRTHSQRTLQAR
jgi:hypothetical protein